MPLDHIQVRKCAEKNYQCERYIELTRVETHAEIGRQKFGRFGFANTREDYRTFVAAAGVALKQLGEFLARIDPDRPQRVVANDAHPERRHFRCARER